MGFKFRGKSPSARLKRRAHGNSISPLAQQPVSTMLPSPMLGESTTEGIMGRGQLSPGFDDNANGSSKLGDIHLANVYAERLQESGVVSVSLRMSDALHREKCH